MEKTLKLYLFSELSKEAKENARNDFLEDGEYFNQIIQYEKDFIKEKYEFKNFDMYVNCGFSQGDGATIETSNFFTPPIIKELKKFLSIKTFNLMKKLINKNLIGCYIDSHHIFASEDNVTFWVEDISYVGEKDINLFTKINDQIEEEIKCAIMEVYSKICDDFLNLVKKIYLDDEAIDRDIESRGYLYTEKGIDEYYL